ncbi:hypothetical protein KIN20_023086 [Parelaphostrongylus tenuis]|uniref:Uncharacterized protein n=1 Tax=Parelaphostrongylus tenuis TaxID=148309 RepID=A0AAD5N9S9_PARTN|nr:hypothetical protein KIN20_023086 [Parelaphostrongylus tenuis]
MFKVLAEIATDEEGETSETPVYDHALPTSGSWAIFTNLGTSIRITHFISEGFSGRREVGRGGSAANWGSLPASVTYASVPTNTGIAGPKRSPTWIGIDSERSQTNPVSISRRPQRDRRKLDEPGTRDRSNDYVCAVRHLTTAPYALLNSNQVKK